MPSGVPLALAGAWLAEEGGQLVHIELQLEGEAGWFRVGRGEEKRGERLGFKEEPEGSPADNPPSTGSPCELVRTFEEVSRPQAIAVELKEL